MTKNVVRLLRCRGTGAERVLWEVVRNRGLGYKFLRQHTISYKYEGQNRFFVVDFYCAELKLVIEVDGQIHESQEEQDNKRTEILKTQGIQVIRFTNREIKNDLRQVIQQLKNRINDS